jgi:hypothetical protein
MYLKITRCGTLLLLVAQPLAGDLVDKVYPGAGWTGHGFIAIRSVGWCRFGQPSLNVQTGPDTPKDEAGHPVCRRGRRLRALTAPNANEVFRFAPAR